MRLFDFPPPLVDRRGITMITRVERTDDLILRARATDLAGRTQPERAEWNRLGYGNNAIQKVPIRVVSASRAPERRT